MISSTPKPSLRPNFSSNKSASCTISAITPTLLSRMPKAFTRVSKVQSSPRWPNPPSYMSYGTAWGGLSSLLSKNKPGFRIDEPPNQPGRRNPVNPWARTSHPFPASIGGTGDFFQFQMRLLGLRLFECLKGPFHLISKGIVEEVNRANLLKALPDARRFSARHRSRRTPSKFLEQQFVIAAARIVKFSLQLGHRMIVN